MIENFPGNVFTVGATGNFLTISQALTAVAKMNPQPSAQTPYRLMLLPGSYNETVTMIPFVHLSGYNAERTVIWNNGPGAVVTGCSNASLGTLTVQSTGGVGQGGPSFQAAQASNLFLENVTLASQCDKNVVLTGPGGHVHFERSRISTLFASITFSSNVIAMSAEGTAFSLRDTRISIVTACLPMVFSVGLRMNSASGEITRGGVTSLAANLPWGNLSFWGQNTCVLKVSDAQVGGAASFGNGLSTVNLYDMGYNPIQAIVAPPQVILTKLQASERTSS